MSRSRRAPVVVAGLALVLAGCGGSEELVVPDGVQAAFSTGTNDVVGAVYAYDRETGYGVPQELVQDGDTVTADDRGGPSGFGVDSPWRGSGTLRWYVGDAPSYSFCIEAGDYHHEVLDAQKGGGSSTRKDTAKGPCGEAPPA